MHPAFRRIGGTSLAFALAAALCGGASPLHAQAITGTLVGRVSDGTSGEGMQGVTILITNTQQGAITRANGGYRVTLNPGRYEVRARYLGYGMARDTVVITAGQETTKDFKLEKSTLSLDEVVVVGTRRADRTVLDAPAPVDVFTAEDVRLTGRTETAQILQALAPSFNFPRPTIADGTDHIRPATLRGLAPDQVLVLVNGKRRHASSLVNVNGTVGRGSTAVDLNAIPASAIDHIEVLRDGAAAQYGSDAIAGVINIILKSNAPDEILTTLGQTKVGDGQVAQVAGNYNMALGDAGFFNLTGEFRYRGATNRSNADLNRQQYFSGDIRNFYPPFNLRTYRQGDAETKDAGVFMNTGKTIGNGVQLYGFGGFSYRLGDAAANYRRAMQDQTVRAIFPNGFLPLIDSRIIDGSIAVGAKGNAAGWLWDLSGVYGQNSFRFDLKNTVNASYGLKSPTSFNAGTFFDNQLTTNLDIVRPLSIGLSSPVNVAIGGEFRRDGYAITAGDEASWKDGGVKILDGPNAGKPAPVGAQGFPGFRPSDEKDVSRTNVAAYVDLETNVLPQLLVGVAGRTEHYSDFGNTTNGKVTSRFEPVKGYALRGTLSTGFRAPALAQSYFSATSTNFVVFNGVNTPFDIKTYPVNSPEAKVLGAVPLKPERSTNYGLGVTLEPFRNFSFTVDAYRIDIRDRIVLSGNFVGSDIQTLLTNAGFPNVSNARFFTNAIDTRTKGIDVVLNYGLTLPNAATLRLTGGYNANTNRVTNTPVTPGPLATHQAQLFDRVERARIELGQPRNSFRMAGTYEQNRLGFTVNTARYGSVTSFGLAPDGSADQTYGAKWITDVGASYKLTRQLRVSGGADNAFDVYPDPNKTVLSTSGLFPYSGTSPFGFNGVFYYVRMTWTR